MDDKTNANLFSEEVIDFVKIANEFCELAENPSPYKRQDLFEKLQEILPHLYSQGLKLPKFDSIFDEGNEKFVTEEEHEIVKKSFASRLGYLDDYLEIVEPDFSDADGPVASKLSEDFADIFQDLKDFLSLFRIGNNEMMNDAIWEVKLSFGTYWGQKLLNALRVVHKTLHSVDPIVEDEEDLKLDKGNADPDTSSWFVSQRQEDYRKLQANDDQ
ncbi:MAG: DUF5063 domain-containing protein [Bacteroidales bacterium]|nr:DUF5063 domain-containing protein [Bacteroidales bacterium]